MASRVPFYFVDAFATRPLTGNPLSLVPDADGLDEAQMRAIAREFNQSEATFMLRPSLPGATVRLRSFYPGWRRGRWCGAQCAGCLVVAGGRGPACLNCHGPWPAAGDRRAGAAGGSGPQVGQPAAVWIDQSSPQFSEVAGGRAQLAACLGLDEQDLLPKEDAQVVSTGAGHLLVPARDRAAVDWAAPGPAQPRPPPEAPWPAT